MLPDCPKPISLPGCFLPITLHFWGPCLQVQPGDSHVCNPSIREGGIRDEVQEFEVILDYRTCETGLQTHDPVSTQNKKGTLVRITEGVLDILMFPRESTSRHILRTWDTGYTAQIILEIPIRMLGGGGILGASEDRASGGLRDRLPHPVDTQTDRHIY